MEAILEAERQREVVRVPSPPAGAGFTVPVSGAETWRVLAVTFVLNTAAGGGARLPRVEYIDGSGTVFAFAGAPFTVAGALSSAFSFVVGALQFGANGAAQIGGPLPDLTLDVNTSIGVAVDAIAGADQLGDIRLYVEQQNTRP